jgi:methyltransferase
MVLPGAPLVRKRPYRLLRHPNYAVAAGEIAVLPLAFGAAAVAILFSLGNLVLILRRVRIEGSALAPQRVI